MHRVFTQSSSSSTPEQRRRFARLLSASSGRRSSAFLGTNIPANGPPATPIIPKSWSPEILRPNAPANDPVDCNAETRLLEALALSEAQTPEPFQPPKSPSHEDERPKLVRIATRTAALSADAVVLTLASPFFICWWLIRLRKRTRQQPASPPRTH